MGAQVYIDPKIELEKARIAAQMQSERLQFERDQAEINAIRAREKSAADAARMREAVQLQADQAAAAEAAKVAARAARSDRGLNPTVMVNPVNDIPIPAVNQTNFSSPSTVTVQSPSQASSQPTNTQSSMGVDPKIAAIIGAALIGAVILIANKKS